jgi:Flp pilus assembly protein TadD
MKEKAANGGGETRTRLLIASAVFLFTLGLYIDTMAPSVTFWDAGEFIATSHILGIPHPPGTPLFVLIGRVWTLLVPFFSVAFEMNLLSTIGGALAAALGYLVVARILEAWVRGDDDLSARIVVHGGGVSAAVASAFLITVWENTTETEVYVLAMVTIAFFAWLVHRWRDQPTPFRGANVLVLIAFVSGLSVGNHLMALLVAPSILLFVILTDWRSLADARPLIAIVLFFFLGLSIHLYLPLRAALDPAINEADPSNWQAFWDVLTRKQYGSRSMFVRTADFFRYQLPLYFIYFNDQFGSDLLTWPFAAVGLWGMVEHFRRDRASFAFYFLLFLLTSLGLVLYLNFRIGHSQGLDEVPNPQMHEVRERDYFFIISFVVFGLWIGMGLASLFNTIRRRLVRAAGGGALLYGIGALVFLPTALPIFLNYHRADRSDNMIAYDYAYNILQSVEPYGVIFTNGDNDTFPLWFLQEVERLRRDVTVANLSLLNTPWYIKQLRDRPLPRPEELSEETREFLEGEGYDLEEWFPEHPIVDMTDKVIDALYPQRLRKALRFTAGELTHEYRRGSIFFIKDLMVLHMIETNAWRRPIYFAVTVSDDNKVELFDHLVMEGLVYRIVEQRADSLARVREEIAYIPETKTYIDVDRSRTLLERVYRFRGVFDDAIYKTPNTRKLLNNYAAAYSYLGRSLLSRNDLPAAIKCYEAAFRFSTRNERFLYLLATLYAQNGDGERADSLFRRFGREGPMDPAYTMAMARSLVRGGDTTRGIEYLDEAISASPDMKPAYRALARIYEQSGEAEKAKDVEEEWLRRHPGESLN